MSDSPAPPPTGPVQPHQITAGGRVATRAIWLLVNLFSGTFRWRVEDHCGLLGGGQQRAIFTLWHNRTILAPLIFRRFIRGDNLERRLAALASASKDGAIAARVLELFDVHAIRGSSSRRGVQAMAELIDAGRAGFDLAVTPDGPRGPRYQVQAGVIALAQFSGLPLVPVSFFLSTKKVLRSWDQHQVPLPFGRCEVTFGEPLRVPRRLSDEEREQLRAELERRMLAITRD